MRRQRVLVRVVLLAVLLGASISALPAQQRGCSHDKSHEFDFWIGEWDVTAGDQVAGHNSIRPILEGESVDAKGGPYFRREPPAHAT